MIVPSNTERKVPISMSAFPPTSSSSSSSSGNMLYLAGPKKVDCTPVSSSTSINSSNRCVIIP